MASEPRYNFDDRSEKRRPRSHSVRYAAVRRRSWFGDTANSKGRGHRELHRRPRRQSPTTAATCSPSPSASLPVQVALPSSFLARKGERYPNTPSALRIGRRLVRTDDAFSLLTRVPKCSQYLPNITPEPRAHSPRWLMRPTCLLQRFGKSSVKSANLMQESVEDRLPQRVPQLIVYPIHHRERPDPGDSPSGLGAAAVDVQVVAEVDHVPLVVHRLIVPRGLHGSARRHTS